jgi:glycosyltransferase involved in cell wall biosynthesis
MNNEKNVGQMISVIIPTFNCGEYIDRAMNSVVNQTVKPQEIIFSDDGSTDDTVMLIEDKQKHFQKIGIITKIIQNSHGGPGAARNAGIKIAKSRWIAFLDADDTWNPVKIETVCLAMIEDSESNCFLHWEDYVRMDGRRNTLEHGKEFYDPKRSIQLQLYRRNFLSTSAVVCRKDLIDSVNGFDETLPNAQDYELWLKMAPAMQLSLIPAVLGEYIEEQNSITAKPYYKRLVSELRVAFRYRRTVPFSLFIHKLFILILSKQWGHLILNLITKSKKHST